MAQRYGHCLNEGPGEIAMAVKMPSTYDKTERPRGALLQFGIGLDFDLCSIGGRLGNLGASLDGVISEIPPFSKFGSNRC